MKAIYVVTILLGASLTSAQTRPQPPSLNLTDRQRACLEAALGKPGSGTRPSQAAVDAALKNCQVTPPSMPAMPPEQDPSSNDSSQGAGVQ